MSFARKLAAYTVASAVVFGAGFQPIEAEPITLEYKDVDITSDEALAIWGDVLPDATRLNGKPEVIVATAENPWRKLTISLMYSDTCGPRDCPMRIVEDGKILTEFLGCQAFMHHEVANSLSAILTCDDIHIIPPKAK